MRSIQVLILVPIIILVFVVMFVVKSDESPTEEGVGILQKLRTSDLEGAVAEFGDNTCHCAPEGGYISYLQYESGHDPNLAFLLGQKFDIGTPRMETLPYNGEKYFLPWDKPEDTIVFLPISFSDANRPLFLPQDMAFGYEMTEKQLQQFINNPSEHWMRSFTTRLRPTLSAGLVKARDPQAKKTEMEKAAEQGLLPAEFSKYLIPKDAAPVQTAPGKTEPATAFADQLPRLQSIVIALKIVRRGALSRWAVRKVGVEKPVLVSNGKQFELKEEPTTPVAR